MSFDGDVYMQTFNFLVLGVDSVSRLNFARHMPLTRRFLLQELGAVELAGFNKVSQQTCRTGRSVCSPSPWASCMPVVFITEFLV